MRAPIPHHSSPSHYCRFLRMDCRSRSGLNAPYRLLDERGYVRGVGGAKGGHAGRRGYVGGYVRGFVGGFVLF